MVKDLSGQVKVTLEALRDVARGAPLNLHAWRRMKSRLILGIVSAIYLKASPNLQVIYVEKWREVVLASHGDASHHTFSKTLKELKQDYTIDVHDYGIVTEYNTFAFTSGRIVHSTYRFLL